MATVARLHDNKVYNYRSIQYTTHFKLVRTSKTNKLVSISVCVCVCVRYGRSPNVIRPPGKCYFFLWGMATVGQSLGEGAQ